MGFDVEGARKAGYSDAEILSHLAPQAKFDVGGARKAGYSETEILTYLAGQAPQPTGAPSQANPAWKETVHDIAGEVLPGAGMIVGGIGGTAAGAITGPWAPAVGLAGAGTGYATGKKAATLLDRIIGFKESTQPQNPALETVKDIGRGAAMEAGGAAAGKAIPLVTKAIGKVAKPLLGRLSGTGTGAVEEAIKSGQGLKGNPLKTQTDFDRAMRGQISGEEVVEHARGALSVLKDQRSAAYQTHLRNLPNADIDTAPVQAKFQELLKQYGVTVTPKGKFDLSRSAVGRRGAKDLEGVVQTFSQWGKKPGDNTALGLDTLKRQLDDFYSDSSQARGFVAGLRKSVHDTISKDVPQYAEMTKGYAEATKLIKDIEAGLMLRKQGMSGRIVADQTLRRLTSSMRDNFALRKELLDVLGNQGGQELSQQVAGYAMRSTLPLGLAGTGPALMGQAVLVQYVNPKLWPVLAASSPRVQGEFLRMFGKAMAETRGAAPLLGRAAAFTAGNERR
jgi:hypothetical protein